MARYAPFDQKDTIDRVVDYDDYWDLSLKDSRWCFTLKKSYGCTPKVGDTVELAGAIDSQIAAGVKINGEIVFHKSDEDLKEDHRQWVENYHLRQMEDFKKNKPQMDKDFDELNDVFKQRIQGFRDRNPDFRWKEEAYEMAAVKEANRMLKHFKTADEIREFGKLGYKEQKKIYPQMDDGHSGNTWGHAIAFAIAYLTNPDSLIPK